MAIHLALHVWPRMCIPGNSACYRRHAQGRQRARVRGRWLCSRLSGAFAVCRRQGARVRGRGHHSADTLLNRAAAEGAVNAAPFAGRLGRSRSRRRCRLCVLRGGLRFERRHRKPVLLLQQSGSNRQSLIEYLHKLAHCRRSQACAPVPVLSLERVTGVSATTLSMPGMFISFQHEQLVLEVCVVEIRQP